MRRRASACAWALLAGCSPALPAAPSDAPPIPAAASAQAAAPIAASVDPPAVAPGPHGALTRDEARRYMVELINRDRASEGLAPVTLDESAATRAGQAHADDMAAHGYLGHWGSDGSVPEQRFTEAGGADMVLENASCFTDERRRALDPSARIDPKNVELAESMFFHERPPNDGHRQNILKPWHKRVGIGVAQPAGTPTEIPVPCFAQEFVDSFGSYAPIPPHAHVGDTLHVHGAVAAPASFAGVGLARVASPKPIPIAELNRRRSYPVPAPYQMYWPAGYQTPIVVRLAAGAFDVDLPVSDHGAAGMYELSVWATVPGSRDFVMVSLRTIQVR